MNRITPFMKFPSSFKQLQRMTTQVRIPSLPREMAICRLLRFPLSLGNLI